MGLTTSEITFLDSLCNLKTTNIEKIHEYTECEFRKLFVDAVRYAYITSEYLEELIGVLTMKVDKLKLTVAESYEKVAKSFGYPNVKFEWLEEAQYGYDAFNCKVTFVRQDVIIIESLINLFNIYLGDYDMEFKIDYRGSLSVNEANDPTVWINKIQGDFKGKQKEIFSEYTKGDCLPIIKLLKVYKSAISGFKNANITGLAQRMNAIDVFNDFYNNDYRMMYISNQQNLIITKARNRIKINGFYFTDDNRNRISIDEYYREKNIGLLAHDLSKIFPVLWEESCGKISYK